MGVTGVAHIQAELLSHLPPHTPVAVVQHASLPQQRHVVCTLQHLGDTLATSGLGSPSVIVVGDVLQGLQALSPGVAPASPAEHAPSALHTPTPQRRAAGA